jgi:Zn-dependent peptidase ImmA (M78 family)
MKTGTQARANVRWQYVRSLAQGLLKDHGEELPIDVEAMAERMNAKVQRVETEDDDLSGFLFRGPGGETVIGVNASHHENRRRFTVAHELGHLLLHASEDIHVDRKGYGYGFGRAMNRDSVSSTGENRDEIEANFFAAELLMPRHVIVRELLDGKTLDFFEKDFDAAVRDLAKRFKVSSQALTVRLVQLKIIEES